MVGADLDHKIKIQLATKILSIENQNARPDEWSDGDFLVPWCLSDRKTTLVSAPDGQKYAVPFVVKFVFCRASNLNSDS